MFEITENVIMAIAGDLEKLLLEKRETIAWAFKKIPEGMKISIGINLDTSSDGIVANYTVIVDR